ncbi:MAG: hypothetical protein ACI8WB_005436 [Phenylobacterium sp.]|jgi:hypothetical protein
MRLIIATVFILLCSLTVQSAPPDKLNELMISVNSVDYESAYSKNEFYIRKQLHFAKKHKIVKINTDLLLNNQSAFSITPFKGAKFIVAANHESKAMPGRLYLWAGQLTFPYINNNNPHFSKVLNDISLTVLSMTVPYAQAQTGSSLGNSHNPDNSKSTIWSVIGEFADRRGKKDKHYIVRLLPNSPQYHLVYLQDNSKVVSGSHQTDLEPSKKLDTFLLDQENNIFR